MSYQDCLQTPGIVCTPDPDIPTSLLSKEDRALLLHCAQSACRLEYVLSGQPDDHPAQRSMLTFTEWFARPDISAAFKFHYSTSAVFDQYADQARNKVARAALVTATMESERVFNHLPVNSSNVSLLDRAVREGRLAAAKLDSTTKYARPQNVKRRTPKSRATGLAPQTRAPLDDWDAAAFLKSMNLSSTLLSNSSPTKPNSKSKSQSKSRSKSDSGFNIPLSLSTLLAMPRATRTAMLNAYCGDASGFPSQSTSPSCATGLAPQTRVSSPAEETSSATSGQTLKSEMSDMHSALTAEHHSVVRECSQGSARPAGTAPPLESDLNDNTTPPSHPASEKKPRERSDAAEIESSVFLPCLGAGSPIPDA